MIPRVNQIKALYYAGLSLTQVAGDFNISRQRVHQIIVGNGKYIGEKRKEYLRHFKFSHTNPQKPCRYCQEGRQL